MGKGFDPRKMMQFRRMVSSVGKGQEISYGELRRQWRHLRRRRETARNIQRIVRELTEIELGFLALDMPRFAAGSGETFTCDLGGHEAGEVAGLLIRKPGESSLQVGCIPCWQKQAMWCGRHDEGRASYEDGTSACRSCVRELTAGMADCGGFVEELRGLLSSFELVVLDAWLETLSQRTNQPQERCFAEAVAGRAVRQASPPLAVVVAIRESRSITSLLPASLATPP